MLASDETERLRWLNESQMKYIADLEEKLTISSYSKLKAQFTQMQKEKADEEEKSANLSSQVAKQEKRFNLLKLSWQKKLMPLANLKGHNLNQNCFERSFIRKNENHRQLKTVNRFRRDNYAVTR